MAETSARDPFLSVIMPTHAGERWIAATLDSLLAQDERGFEVIVIDSSPDDATLAVARAYSDRLDMRIHKRPDVKPWTAKTNLGVEMARAAHVCMLHQDDLWMPGRAAAVRGWLAAEPGAAMHLNPVYIVDENGRQLGVWQCPLPVGAPVPRDMMLERLLVQCFISTPAPVMRRDAFRVVGGMQEALWYAGDWDLYLRLAKHGVTVYHDDVLSCFRIHGSSLTVAGSERIDEFERQLRLVLEAHIGVLPHARRARIAPLAEASIRVNSALRAAAGGDIGALLGALATVLRLGPAGAHAYLRDSRIYERLMPRVRAKMAGNL